MKQLSFLTILLIIISCNKENNNKIPDLSGMYLDSLTYTRSQPGGFVVKDTVIQKIVYKLNDSSYKMGALYNLDTNLAPNTPLPFPIRFTVRTDNTIKVDTFSVIASFSGAYYDPVKQTINNIHRISNPTPQLY